MRRLALLATLVLGCGRGEEPVMPARPVRTPTPRPQPAAAASPAGATPAASPLAPPSPTPGPGPLRPSTPAPRPGPGGEAEVRSLVEAWRRAWEGKDAVAFAGFYHPAFRSGRMDRERFLDHKRGVFARAGDLEVRLEDLRVTVSGERARVELTQVYRNGPLADRGKKVLELRRHEGAWKIVAEEFERAR